MLLLCLFLGIFIFLGSLLGLHFKKNKKIMNLSISVVFGSLIFLLLFKIIPQYFKTMLEDINLFKSIICLVILFAIGIIILEIIHVFSPHEKYTNNNEKYFKHIGIIFSSVIFLYNIINAINLYQTNITLGILNCILTGFINIFIGFMISSILSNSKLPKKSILKLCLLVSLAPFIGGFIYIIFNGISNLMMGILLGINIGMLIHILLFELLIYIQHIKNKKILKIGIMFGLLLSFISIIVGLIIR